MNLRIAKDSLTRLKDGITIALTGAGISADSGMPTFRGNNGLWKKYQPHELATPSAFSQNPQLIWEWYSWRLEKLLSVAPNEAHYALAQLEKMGMLELIISQNVDDLHERAGSTKIVKLHGSLIHTKCIRCTKKEPIVTPPQAIPYCECGGMLRPDVVWFGESLSAQIQEAAFHEAATCDSMLIIGTSGIVYPAAFLPSIAKKEGALIIEFNVTPTAITPLADYFIAAPAAESLPKFIANF